MNKFDEYSPWIAVSTETKTKNDTSPFQNELEAYTPFKDVNEEVLYEQVETNEFVDSFEMEDDEISDNALKEREHNYEHYASEFKNEDNGKETEHYLEETEDEYEVVEDQADEYEFEEKENRADNLTIRDNLIKQQKAIQSNIIDIANEELRIWAGKDELKPPSMRNDVERYWSACGLSSTKINEKITERLYDIANKKPRRHPWSSAFITYVMRKATNNLFPISSAHNRYVIWAKQKKSDSMFYAYPIDQVTIEVGDIIVNARNTKGQVATYDNIEEKPNAHGDIVIEVDYINEKAKVFGGNKAGGKGGTVKSEFVDLTSEGKIKQQLITIKSKKYNKYIAVVKLLPPLITQPSKSGITSISGKRTDKDWSKAIRLNRDYADKLGWNKFYDQINELLLSFSGQQNVSLGEEAFAQAVASWQQQQGFSAKDCDGIIGPNTWEIMKQFISKNYTVSTPIIDLVAAYEKMNLESLRLSFDAFRVACNGYRKLDQSSQLKNNKVLSILDFTQSSKNKRFYILDMINQTVLLQTNVAHGANGPRERATKFSNEPGSRMSSLGFYLTQETYQSKKNGLSLRLKGLEKGFNDNARARAIVVHGASYVKENGDVGRSWGCPAVPMNRRDEVINTIKNGTCLFLYYNDPEYLSKSLLAGDQPSVSQEGFFQNSFETDENESYWIDQENLSLDELESMVHLHENYEEESSEFNYLESEIDPPPANTPTGNPVSFAPVPPKGSYWPIQTKAPEGRLVSYVSEDGRTIGSAGRKFLANRKTSTGEPRHHVGIDLYANFNEPVVACDNGKILSFKRFLTTKGGNDTNSLVVQHSNVIINYGEVGPSSLDRLNLHEGDAVKAGQVIGFIGATGMLHFETYKILDDSRDIPPHRWMKSDSAPPASLYNPTKYLLYLKQFGLSKTGAITSSASPVTAPPQQWSDAIRLNRYYQDKLGWNQYYDKINDLLLPFSGLQNVSLGEEAFAKAVVAWQQKQGFPAKDSDGIIGPKTWNIMQPLINISLRSKNSTSNHPVITKIIDNVQSSGLVKYNWNDRGKSPIGYLNGMALTYARIYCCYKSGLNLPENLKDKFTFLMAKGITPGSDKNKDAVARYADKFTAFGGNVSVEGIPVLRSIFTILLGLGMRESSGKHCTGWDRGKLTGWGKSEKIVQPTATNSEAGLFQISYDIGVGRGDFKELYEQYKNGHHSSLLEYFKENVSCSAKNLQNYGSGVGLDFQKFSKVNPAFTVVLAALALRTKANHWGPIRKNKVELLQQSWSLLVAVETAIDTLNGCNAVN